MNNQIDNGQRDGSGGLLNSLFMRLGFRRQPRPVMQQADTLLSEQVRLLYANLPASLIISALLALILIKVQASVIAPDELLAWSAILGAFLLGRAALYVVWHRHTGSTNQADMNRWLHWFRIGAIGSGIVWGIGGVLLAPSGDPVHKVYISFVLAGLSAGAATTLAIDSLSAVGFLLSVLLPNIVFLVTEGDTVSLGMSAMIMLFLFFLLASARQTGIQLEENFRLRLKAKQNESWLRKMLETSPIATRIVDVADNQVVFANNSYIELIGSISEEVVGIDPSQYYVHPEEYAEVMEQLRQGGQVTNKLVEIHLRGNEVRNKWTLASYFSFEYQDKPAALGWFYDITDRKIMEETLRDNRTQLQAILDSSPVGIGWSNFDGKVEYINSKFIELFGYTMEDIPTVQDWYRQAYPDETFRNEIVGEWARAVAAARDVGAKPPTLEAPVVCKNGSVRHVIISVSWVGGHRLVNFSDISDRWLAEQRDRARNATLEMIATGSSLQQILNSIVLSVETEDVRMICSILLLDRDGLHLRIGAAPSLPTFYNQAIEGLEIGEGVGSCGTAAFTKQRVVVADIRSHPYWANAKDIAARAELVSCWSEPILSSKNRLLGTFAIYHRQPGLPDDAALELIGYAANLASIAIEHHQANEELERQAHTDFLTELNNRRYFMELAESELSRALRYRKALSLCMFDVDHFKAVNDTHGHKTGDLVLQTLSTVVRQTLRKLDIVGRLGGEEFAAILPETNADAALEAAERLRCAIADTEMRTDAGTPLHITVSIGVATRLDESVNVEALLKQADEALYAAKNSGRNQVRMAANVPPEGRINILADLVKLSWHTVYECGHPLIDDQHRTLFNQVNDLLAAILAGCPTDQVLKVIESVIDDIAQHFQCEEAIFAEIGFPGAMEHIVIHRQLLERAIDLTNGIRTDSITIGELFQYLAHDLIAKHMLKEDRKFFPYL